MRSVLLLALFYRRETNRSPGRLNDLLVFTQLENWCSYEPRPISLCLVRICQTVCMTWTKSERFGGTEGL